MRHWLREASSRRSPRHGNSGFRTTVIAAAPALFSAANPLALALMKDEATPATAAFGTATLWQTNARRDVADNTRETFNMVIKFMPNDKGNPQGKLADAEVHFTDGELQGLKLVGFAVWERRNGPGRNVTFPARSYAVNGERRSFALLRPYADTAPQERVRDLILHAYEEFQAQVAVAS
jgi:hypothetical protein